VGDWRYLAYRLNGDGTETQLDPDLPLSGVSLTRAVSGAGGFQAKIDPAVARLLGPDGQPILQPWSTAIYSEESGQIRHGCILTNRAKGDSSLELSGAGFTAAIKGQPYTGSKFFVKTDPIDIARHIWDHWQSFRGGNLGMRLDRSTKAGTLIGTTLTQAQFDSRNGPMTFEAGPYKLNEWETSDLGGRVDSLATDYNFDYQEDHFWVGEVVGHSLGFGAPRIGTRRADLRFVVGENIFMPPTIDDDETAYASEVLVLGAGNGATMKRALVPRAAETRLRRVRIATDNTLKTDAAPRARGQSLLPLLTGRGDVTDLVIADNDNAPLGSWNEGDEIELHTDSAWGDDSIWFRIESTTISPEAPNVATVSVVRADKIPT
jgi:hypothetical protein